MAKLIGLSRAKDLIYTGRLLDANEAHALGIIDYLVPTSSTSSSTSSSTTSSAAAADQGPAFQRALQLAQQISANAPLAIRAAKVAIDKGAGAGLDIESGLDLERACYNGLMHSHDRLEGLRAFKEKRKPAYKGE